MTLIQERDSYIFSFQDGASRLASRLNAVGWENNRAGYCFDGLTRVDKGGPYLFQYTLSGRGEIRIGSRFYRLDPGYAFLIHFHGDYCYCLPDESDHYECLFISLQGEEAAKCWSHIGETLGAVVYLPEYSTPVRTLRAIHREAGRRNITDAYRGSMLAYQFIMELYRFCRGYDSRQTWPDVVAEAARFMRERYSDIDGLDKVAAHLGVSKGHLIKLFHRTVGKTPMEFLTGIRMEKAVERLRGSAQTLNEIAAGLGYSDVNYFSKVFRKFFGIPPGKFRKNPPADHFLFD
jgi:AraC-like DNA-binding protein